MGVAKQRGVLRERWRRAQQSPVGRASLSRAGAQASLAAADRASGANTLAAESRLAEAGKQASDGVDSAVHCELRDPKDGPPVGKWRHVTTIFMFP